jgi:thiol-disulfide isomerase/thioredoxin/tRNA G46 methylase TrmB
MFLIKSLLLLVSCCQLTVDSTPQFTVEAVPQFKVTVEQPVIPQQVVKAEPECRLEMWTATWCSACRQAKPEVEAAAKELGIELREINYDEWSSEGARYGIRSLPTLNVVIGGVFHSKDQLVGVYSKQQIIDAVRSARKTKRELKKTKPKPVQVHLKYPKVTSTRWGTYDLEKWTRQCSSNNCSMCNTLDAKQQEYFSQFNQTALPGQDPTPEETMIAAIEAAKLKPSSLFYDAGCGDGRVLIHAVQTSGCKAIGVEIDPTKVKEAVQNVSNAGLEESIKVIEGDIRDFDPVANGVTTVYCYLFDVPELASLFKGVDTVVSPFHEIPQLSMIKIDDVWVYNKH